MGNEKVLSDEILQDAQRRAERTRKRAEREAKKILKEAEAEAGATAEKALGAAQRRADRIADSILATVGQEAQRARLEAREAELTKLFERAIERLADRSTRDYPAVLATLAAQAIGAMRTDAVVLAFAGPDRPIVTEAWLEDVRRRAGGNVAVSVSDAPAPIRGGVVARSADGRLLYDNSFAARLERRRPELRQQVAARVYAQPEATEATGKMPVPPGKEQA